MTWVAEDGVRYLRPEIVLVQSTSARRKDDPDFEASLPVLADDQRQWMRAAL